MFVDRLLLLRFLKIYDFDLEKAKELLVVCLETRTQHPSLFEKRDMLDDEFQRVIEFQQVFEMIPRTPENHKVSIFRISGKTEKYEICEVLRFMIAALDVKLVSFQEEDENEDALPHDGEIFVNDMTHFGLRNVMQVRLTQI